MVLFCTEEFWSVTFIYSPKAQAFKDITVIRSAITIFPLLALPVIFYNLLVFVSAATNAGPVILESGVAVSPLVGMLGGPLISIPMMSGVSWQLSGGELLVLLSVCLLFLEILKSTSTGTATIINHGVSMMIFIICLVEFLSWPHFATSTFFIIMVMTLLDVLSGVVVTIISARRDFAVEDGF